MSKIISLVLWIVIAAYINSKVIKSSEYGYLWGYIAGSIGMVILR